jgi:hypothetical protein
MRRFVTSSLCLLLLTSSVVAQDYDPAAAAAAQRDAMKALPPIDGLWRGPAWTILPNGKKSHVTQTERIGPFLDGSVKVLEGRSFAADESTTFHALGVISYDPSKKTYSLRSYAQGRSGDFDLKLSADGFIWTIVAGPMTIRYTATIKGGKWHQIGERLIDGKEPVQFFEMNLVRVGDSDWPAANGVKPK